MITITNPKRMKILWKTMATYDKSDANQISMPKLKNFTKYFEVCH